MGLGDGGGTGRRGGGDEKLNRCGGSGSGRREISAASPAEAMGRGGGGGENRRRGWRAMSPQKDPRGGQGGGSTPV
jgi:hypothetical protein